MFVLQEKPNKYARARSLILIQDETMSERERERERERIISKTTYIVFVEAFP